MRNPNWYGKAPNFFHAARKQVGDTAFFKGLRSYVDTYRYKWACLDCFRKELVKTGGASSGRPARSSPRRAAAPPHRSRYG